MGTPPDGGNSDGAAKSTSVEEHAEAVRNSPNVLDRWSLSIVDAMKAESALIRDATRHGGLAGSAREALVRSVFHRLLPTSYEVGTGEIVDTLGGRSNQIDIVIYRRDFPRLRLPDGSSVFMAEGVLATVEVKTTLNATTLPEALDNCASVSRLAFNVVAGPRDKLAKARGLQLSAGLGYVHEDPLETARFELVGRPPTFVFSFDGYMRDARALADAVASWIDEREDASLGRFPAAICAQGCYARRNAAPYALSEPVVAVVGVDPSPLRILVLQLLYELVRKAPIPPDSDGLVPNLDQWLSGIVVPGFRSKVGEVTNLSPKPQGGSSSR